MPKSIQLVFPDGRKLQGLFDGKWHFICYSVHMAPAYFTLEEFGQLQKQLPGPK